MSIRTITPEEQAERVILRAIYDAFEKWRAGRNGYKSEDVPPSLVITNAQRSRLEILDFIAAPPTKKFAYVEEQAVSKILVRVKTWTGDLLGDVIWQGHPYHCGGFGSVRVNFRAKMITGHTYSGVYYQSSGHYAMLTQIKTKRLARAKKPSLGSSLPTPFPQLGRLLDANEVVTPDHLVRWSTTPRDAWTTISPRSPFVGLPVATLRVRHGQPDLQFAERKEIT